VCRDLARSLALGVVAAKPDGPEEHPGRDGEHHDARERTEVARRTAAASPAKTSTGWRNIGR
jgi:hypothetical protein